MTRQGHHGHHHPPLPRATACGVATEDEEDDNDEEDDEVDENDETGTTGKTAPNRIMGGTTTIPHSSGNDGEWQHRNNDNDAQRRPRRRTRHPPHAYEQPLAGWIVDAARLQRQTRGDEEDVMAPSTRPPLRALARRVDRVLTAPSPPP
jgi:hypothetical protein